MSSEQMQKKFRLFLLRRKRGLPKLPYLERAKQERLAAARAQYAHEEARKADLEKRRADHYSSISNALIEIGRREALH